MIICTNRAEFLYVTAWCEYDNVTPLLRGEPDAYPYCIDPEDGSRTYLLDRAVDYRSFREFINETLS